MSAATAAEGNYIENGILYNRLGRVVDPGSCRQPNLNATNATQQ